MNRLSLWHEMICKKDCVYKLQNKTTFCIPKLEKLVINLSSNEVINNPKEMLICITAAELLTNQKPIIYRAKKSLSEFRLKKNSVIGLKITLRKNHLFDLLENFIFLYIPKLNYFNGLNKLTNLNSTNSLSIGLKNLISFPQLNQNALRFKKSLGCTFTFILKYPTISGPNVIINGCQMPYKLN